MLNAGNVIVSREDADKGSEECKRYLRKTGRG